MADDTITFPVEATHIMMFARAIGDYAPEFHDAEAAKNTDAGGIIAPGEAPGETRMEWHDGQRMAQHHLRVVETAAKYHVAVNAHEPIKDTGLRRTYPNWVGREGARGMEYNAWGAFANGPDHEPTLVYTRMLSGPMDFTPGVLSLEGADHAPLASTLADYLLPGPVEVPDLRILHMESPSPYTRFGQKGIGESGAIGPPAAIGNAINDALKEMGVEVDATPITPRRLLTLIQAAQS